MSSFLFSLLLFFITLHSSSLHLLFHLLFLQHASNSHHLALILCYWMIQKNPTRVQANEANPSTTTRCWTLWWGLDQAEEEEGVIKSASVFNLHSMVNALSCSSHSGSGCGHTIHKPREGVSRSDAMLDGSLVDGCRQSVGRLSFIQTIMPSRQSSARAPSLVQGII